MDTMIMTAQSIVPGILALVILTGILIIPFKRAFKPIDYTDRRIKESVIGKVAFQEVTNGLSQNQIYTKKGPIRVVIQKKIDAKRIFYNTLYLEPDFQMMLMQNDIINEDSQIPPHKKDQIEYYLYQYGLQHKESSSVYEEPKTYTDKREKNKKQDWAVVKSEPNTKQGEEQDIPETKYVTTELEKPSHPEKASISNPQTDMFHTPEDSITPEEFMAMRKQKPFKLHGVYILFNATKEKYYVGQANQTDRIYQHFTGHGNADVYADYKYGDQFSIRWEWLEASSFSDLNAMERHYIAVYDSYQNGYNKTAGNKAPYKPRLKRGEFKDVEDAADFLVNAVTHCAASMDIPEPVIIKVLAKSFETGVSPEYRSNLVVKLLNRILERQHVA